MRRISLSSEDTRPLKQITQPNSVNGRRWLAERGRWLLTVLIALTSCTLVMTIALFIRAIPARTAVDSDGELKVHIRYDGSLDSVSTSADTVEELLAERGFALREGSMLSHAGNVRLGDGMVLRIKTARDIVIDEDGIQRTIKTTLENPLEILQKAGLEVSSADKLWVNGALADYRALPGWTVPARHIQIRRALSLTVIDDGEPSTIVTMADTVGDALFDAGISLYLTDEVDPPLDSAVAAALTITIKRAIPVELLVDGVVIEARTNAARVADVLVELSAPLFALDFVTPPGDTAVSENMRIEIVRVTEEVVTQSETIAHETLYQPNAQLGIDLRAVVQQGRDGKREIRNRVRYENGAEVSRVVSESLEVEAPMDQIIAYGTKIVEQTVPGTALSYWRKHCVVATYYTPTGNRTATGTEVYKGVIAAKRRFIPLRTHVYVPGYGEGTILDTGAGPSSTDYWIDLGFGSEEEAKQWNAATRYTWVYLLWPPPVSINYRLPPWTPARSPSGSCA